mgnify:CR=1 FL=1
MASQGRSNDVECQINGENLLNQTQEDVTFLNETTSSHIIRDADFFDLSDPEKRYNFQNEVSHSPYRVIRVVREPSESCLRVILQC